MSTVYDFNDNMLDFEDTDMFLSAILSSVPAWDKMSNPYDLDQPGLAGLGFTDRSALPLNTSLDINDPESSDAVSVNSSLPSTANFDRSLFPTNDQQKRSSFSTASYSELVTSTNSNEGTPNTTMLSPHTLPEGMTDHKKFKPEEDEEEEEPAPKARRSKASPKSKVSKPGKRPKVSHNMIEKKYRTNINTKIYELRDAVPTLKIASGKANVLLSDLEGLAPAAKLNKASVLTKATEYIKHLEKKNETMLAQIAQLQLLIGDANANSPNVMPRQNMKVEDQQPNLGLQMPLDGQYPGGFGFAPENNYNTTVNYEAQNPPPQFAQQQQQATYQPYNSNWMMGGLATVMGASVLSTDNFKGLSAFPFMPSFLSHPSPAALQLLTIFRCGLIFFGIYLMVLPIINSFKRPGKTKAQAENQWLTWLLVSIGLQVPKPLPPIDKERILSHLIDGCSDPQYWVRDYAILSSSEVTFETCFLTVLVGTILSTKFPIAASFVKPNLLTRSTLLSKLNASEDNPALQKLSELFKTSDGVSMFTSEQIITRVVNITERENIFAGVKKGDNSLAYIEVFKHNRKDIYAIIFGWRILDLLHDLNLSYLDLLTMQVDDEETKKAEQSLKASVQSIGKLLKDCNEECLKQYYLSMACLLNPESTPELVSTIKGGIVKTISSVNSYFDGQDLTDSEAVSSSEDEEDESEDTEIEEERKKSGITDTVKGMKSLIYSLNLVNEEKYIVLATSSILYYLHQDDESEQLKQLLRHLKFGGEKVPLSTLSFTCLLKVICSILKEGDDKQASSLSVEESEILEQLVKAARGWLNDDKKNQFLEHSFRSDLTDLVMTKGMLLNSY